MIVSMSPPVAPKRVVVVVYEGLQGLDLAGPFEVFTGASKLAVGRGAKAPAYEVEIVAPSAEPIRTASGMTLTPDRELSRCRGSIDTLVVAGGFGWRAAVEDETLVRWIADAAGRSRRVSSVCSGAFLLAEAGLLEGKRATTHWASCEELAARHPSIDVDPDSIYVHDGKVWTSAGVTAGMDLALAMVEEDLGRDVALEIARWLVMFVQRPGGQSQFSTHLAAQRAERRPLRDLQAWIADNLDADLRVEALAERVHMSTRNFARAFGREVGLTPGAYVEAVRIERAKQRLEEAGEPVEAVARSCGFGSAETMRRAFSRRVGVPPADYRARFRRQAELAPTAGRR
jgi:transcriptional regulator GlxA family with amidase domain